MQCKICGMPLGKKDTFCPACGWKAPKPKAQADETSNQSFFSLFRKNPKNDSK